MSIDSLEIINYKTTDMIGAGFLVDLANFVTYCKEFYHIDYGLYPLATSNEIENAIGEYLTEPHTIDIQFDSIDRENVRDIILSYK